MIQTLNVLYIISTYSTTNRTIAFSQKMFFLNILIYLANPVLH